MPTFNSSSRSKIAKEMLDIRREKNESLEKFDKRNFIYRILNKKERKEIIENFENKIDEIREKPGYKEALKIHINEERRKRLARKGSLSLYANDGYANYQSIPKEDAKIAAEIYGEGYKPLSDFLEICFENEIRTFACCSGHPEIGYNTSYVYFDGNNEKLKRLVEFIIEENLADKIGMYINDIDNKKHLKICVFTDITRRDNFYRRCTEKLKEITKENDGRGNKENLTTDKIKSLLEQHPSGAQAILNVRERKVTIYSDETKEYLIDDIN